MATRKTVVDPSPVAAPAAGQKAGRASVAVKPAKASKPLKPQKLHRKPVRDSFTMPEADVALTATLKARALAARPGTTKSELLRAGLHTLAALDTPALVVVLEHLEPAKIGRPKTLA